MSQQSNKKNKYTDIRPTYWLFKILPPVLHPYGLLARLDRPIGWWLLLLPTLWGMAIANLVAVFNLDNNITPLSHGGADYIFYGVLFFIGSVAMRGAGCTWNDITDRHLDASVERTRHRPLPSGQVTVKQAVIFMGIQCIIGLAVLLTLPMYAIMTTLLSVGLIIIYPFMKRITHFPQLVLGLAFNWGIFVGYTTLGGTLSIGDSSTWVVLLIYSAAVFWTLAYDTIYAFQDIQDDLSAGIKSTAIRFMKTPKTFVGSCYGIMITLFATALFVINANPMAYIGLGAFAIQAYLIVMRIDMNNPEINLRLFKQNKLSGLLILVLLFVAGSPM